MFNFFKRAFCPYVPVLCRIDIKFQKSIPATVPIEIGFVYQDGPTKTITIDAVKGTVTNEITAVDVVVHVPNE